MTKPRIPKIGPSAARGLTPSVFISVVLDLSALGPAVVLLLFALTELGSIASNSERGLLPVPGWPDSGMAVVVAPDALTCSAMIVTSVWLTHTLCSVSLLTPYTVTYDRAWCVVPNRIFVAVRRP